MRRLLALFLILAAPVGASYVEVNGTGAYVYAQADSHSVKRGHAEKGAAYQLIQDAQVNGYYRIFFDDQEGFVYRTRVRAHLGDAEAYAAPVTYTGTQVPRTFQYGEPIDHSQQPRVLLEREAYKVWYDPTRKVALWSAYAYRPTGTTSARCQDCFAEDPEAPSHPGTYPKLTDYQGVYKANMTGFDKGHQSPDASLKVYGFEQQKETYYLSNMTPQYSNTNQGIWREWEDKVRGLATPESPVWVVTGPVFNAGTPGHPVKPGGPWIPDAYFMVVSRGNGRPDVAAILVKNQQLRLSWAEHYKETLATVAQVQDLTGFDFLSALPDDVEKDLESRVNDLWQ
ncbi:MAG TPA: DNA/RNA non-specific endonuclease [bacterium]|nr:DNA/RNA non-specific endonuclease [bacterium]